jgi:hypothetical protein
MFQACIEIYSWTCVTYFRHLSACKLTYRILYHRNPKVSRPESQNFVDFIDSIFYYGDHSGRAV